jgi:hypothetical protein
MEERVLPLLDILDIERAKLQGLINVVCKPKLKVFVILAQ